jgi:GGDEF domain-containing protein
VEVLRHAIASGIEAYVTILNYRADGTVREPFEMPARTPLEIRASVGVSIYPRDAATIEDLMRHTDVAMYMAKAGVTDAFHVYHTKATPTGHAGGDEFDAGGRSTSWRGSSPARRSRWCFSRSSRSIPPP